MKTRTKTLLLLFGYAAAYALGQSLVRPTGPGSAATLYMVLTLYSVVLVVLGHRVSRIVGAALCLMFLILFLQHRAARREFAERMNRQLEMRRQEAMVVEDSVLHPTNAPPNVPAPDAAQ